MLLKGSSTTLYARCIVHDTCKQFDDEFVCPIERAFLKDIERNMKWDKRNKRWNQLCRQNSIWLIPLLCIFSFIVSNHILQHDITLLMVHFTGEIIKGGWVQVVSIIISAIMCLVCPALLSLFLYVVQRRDVLHHKCLSR